MALRTRFEGCDDIGVFVRLTNSYCIVGLGSSGNYRSLFEHELSAQMPVIHATIGDCSIVGRLCVGNSKGLLVPCTTTDSEFEHIKNCLPENVRFQRVDEPLCALGNCIVCNDSTALIHPQLSKETELIIQEVLEVETFRHTINNTELVGTYCVLNNYGGVVHPKTPLAEMDELSAILKIQIGAGTINRGCDMLGAGCCVNDSTAFTGMSTSATELAVVETMFDLRRSEMSKRNTLGLDVVRDITSALVDDISCEKK